MRASADVRPHRRGDSGSRSVVSPPPPGSPPQTWGLAERPIDRRHEPHFTPTGVGLGGRPSAASSAWRFTPTRTGGLDSAAGMDVSVRPPQAWELDVGSGLGGVWDWFTPTGVETGHNPDRRARPGRGSPPRAWGLGGSPSRQRTPSPVHPYGRGDWRPRFSRRRRTCGSPPRVWGLDVRSRLRPFA